MEKKLYNVMETLIFTKLSHLIKDIDCCCKCDECILDIVALALNNLPTKYVATSKGEIMLKALFQLQHQDAMLTKEIVKAAKIVGDNPRHFIDKPIYDVSPQHIKDLYDIIYFSKSITLDNEE